MTDIAAPSPIPSIHEPTASSSAPAALAQDGPTVQAMANGHTHQMASTKAAESLPNIGEMEARCGGCKGVIDQEGGGVVVAFGSSLWHVGCFRCAKCKEKVSADTNLLLLSDGSPVCGNCSYQCFVCKQAITEEAIMTGDESYHAHCFTCRTCKRRIEELVFAKTSQGIYCMGCHNERVAKQRRHVEQKRQRAARKEREREEREKDEERKRQAAGSASGAASDTDRLGTNMASSSGTAGSSNHLRLASPIGFNVGPGSTATTPYTTPLTGTGNAVFPDASPVASSENGSSIPRSRDLSVDQQLNVSRSASPSNGGKRSESPLPPLPQSPSDMTLNFSQAQMQARGPSPVIPGPGQSQAQSQSQSQSPALTNSPSSSSQKGGSSTGIGLGVGPVGLSVPTSKADKRRSINPGMSFNMDSSNSTYAHGAEPRLSPLPPSPLRASFTDAPRGSLDSRRPPPSPSTGAGAAGDSFPFRATDGQTGASGPPPRKSSLDPSQLTNGPLGPRARGPSTAPVPYESRLGGGGGGGGTQPLNVKTKDKDGSGLAGTGSSGSTSTPKIGAPALPTMSFSLSDDFASILGGMDGTGSGTAGSGSTDRQLHAEPVSDESPPVSPLPGQSNSNTSTSMTRSPMVGSLSSAALAAGMPSAGLGRSASPSSSRDRLEPGPSAPFLRSRQASAESTYSLSGRLGQDSAFGQVVSIVAEAKHNGKEKVEVDLGLLSGIVGEVEELRDALSGLKSKYTGVKQYSHGLTVAGEEYDREVALRRDLELENTRLRAQMHSQTARLSVISGDERKAETMRRRSHDLANSLTGLEREMSRLKAQRDMTLAEIEELQKRTNTPSAAEGGALQESLTSRLDTIREQYREELEPLTAQREALQREIADLRETKEQYIEESTALSAKNDELAELNQSLSRQAESLQDVLSRRNPLFSSSKGQRQHPSTSPSISSLATSATLHEVPEETARVVKVTKPEPQPIEAAPARRFKWYGYKSSKGPSAVTDAAGQGGLGGAQGSGGGGSGNNSGHSGISRPLAVISGGVSAVGTAAGLAVATAASAASGVVGGSSPGSNGLHVPGGNGAGGAQRPSTEMGLREHAFQQHSTMRLTRCELCGEKMWGLQEVKCASCGVVCHAKCSEKLPRSCTGSKNSGMDMDGPLPPSMFGRDLSEQTSSDRAEVPVIVSKSIAAVEAVGMEYEGIYRKTGGSSQSKQITQLFERGDYDAFDLSDVEVFNDISSVTSVLKTYFRQLPNPLLTHELHESFVAASAIKEVSNKQAAFTALLKELPKDHYNTLRALMLHLNRVMQASGSNLMTSQNLGVVFGPTLMRSSDPGREFADMGGKAMCVTWMVENAPNAFAEARS